MNFLTTVKNGGKNVVLTPLSDTVKLKSKSLPVGDIETSAKDDEKASSDEISEELAHSSHSLKSYMYKTIFSAKDKVVILSEEECDSLVKAYWDRFDFEIAERNLRACLAAFEDDIRSTCGEVGRHKVSTRTIKAYYDYHKLTYESNCEISVFRHVTHMVGVTLRLSHDGFLYGGIENFQLHVKGGCKERTR
jgi:hypothetical protein